jgi:hypothetical protein
MIIKFRPIEQQSCSELTGFHVRSERCCGDLERLRRVWGLALLGILPSGAEVVRRMASRQLQRIP